MTRSIKQSRTCAPIQSGTAGPSVTQFATVAELITASQGGLAEGYYEVPGVWVTFWNGSTFSPPAPDNMILGAPIDNTTPSIIVNLVFPSGSLDFVDPDAPTDVDTGTGWSVL